jgi:hypothetical protein
VNSFLSDLPLLGVLAGTLLLVLGSLELGYRWAAARRAKHRDEDEATVGGVVGATLGLLAFLLAVTFGIADDAFHARKVALTNEMNAIQMSYMSSDLAADADRDQIRVLLREYVEQRLRWADGTPDPPGRSANELLDRLWKASSAVARKNPGTVDVLLGYVATVGYHVGVAGKGRTPVMLAVAIAFSVTIMVIADLDRPGKGFINVSQQPMADLRARLTANR